jgi:hypothetical protein
MTEVLLLVALKTDQPDIARRIRLILAAAEPIVPDTEACVFAKDVDELVAADLDALAQFMDPDNIARLRIGATSTA